MIEAVSGNLLSADVEALVNTVNTVGVMGKGLALQFKKSWPDNFSAFAKACQSGEVVPGKMHVYSLNGMLNPRFIINFPTKRHWREGSRLEDIETGLLALVEEIHRRKIQSIAIPPLGCGYGGLDWSVVRSLIEQTFANLPEVNVLLYSPQVEVANQ
jgi:O-acetyl-ADP-ribose deacetylase (regulator of RNase III)